jgi:hypothetical protein
VQLYYLQVDTGSDIMWVDCAPCYNCPMKTSLPVNPSTKLDFCFWHTMCEIVDPHIALRCQELGFRVWGRVEINEGATLAAGGFVCVDSSYSLLSITLINSPCCTL